ncbi:MAG: translation initiation factor IF-3 C-terminal domain-containing protein, partial [Micrococcales bacterium]|nr:translation initiation factor IF-3 C-terminal domain-containing protein [Micrococcales bacterium]
GREQSRPELGYRLLQRLAQDVAELGFVESAPKQDGRNMIMVLGPTKKKADARAEQRRKRDDAKASAGDEAEVAAHAGEHDTTEQVDEGIVTADEQIPQPETAQA